LSISETCEIILDQAAYSMFKNDEENEQTESITIEKGIKFLIFLLFNFKVYLLILLLLIAVIQLKKIYQMKKLKI